MAAWVILDNASKAPPALCSVHAAMPALMKTITQIAMPVVYDKGSLFLGPEAMTLQRRLQHPEAIDHEACELHDEEHEQRGLGGFSNSFGPSKAKTATAELEV